MNSIDDQLERLFRSAVRAEKITSELAMPISAEQRVLAAWRRGARDESDEALVVLLRRVLIGACLVTLLALAASYEELLDKDNNAPEIATAALQLTIAP